MLYIHYVYIIKTIDIILAIPFYLGLVNLLLNKFITCISVLPYKYVLKLGSVYAIMTTILLS